MKEDGADGIAADKAQRSQGIGGFPGDFYFKKFPKGNVLVIGLKVLEPSQGMKHIGYGGECNNEEQPPGKGLKIFQDLKGADFDNDPGEKDYSEDTQDGLKGLKVFKGHTKEFLFHYTLKKQDVSYSP